MRFGTDLSIAGLLLLGACAGQVHHVPKPTERQMSAAERDVLAEPDLPNPPRSMTESEASQTLAAVVRRVHPAGQQVCHETGAGNCYWRYRFSPDPSLNAFSTASGYVVLNRGLAEQTANDDEIAFVLCHELGHHSASHPVTGNSNARLGGLVGGVVGLALDVATGGSGGFTQLGQSMGREVGWLSYSKEQEREADYLGVVIAYRAGVDLDKARGVVLMMARQSGKRESSALDTHPEGAERLAGFDRAVAAVRASNGALPPRAK